MLNSKRSHSIEILETPYATVTSGGHWFHATRETVKEYVPDLLKSYSFEELISRAVTWIESADSLSMLLFFLLVPFLNVWISALIVLLFHYFWYHQKSAFVVIYFTPLLSLFNRDFFQLLTAAVVLSFMGIYGMYLATALGIFFFFLFKLGLLRRLWDRLDLRRKGKERLPLNDRVLKMILIRYSLYENVPPVEIEKMDREVQRAVIERDKKR